MALMGTPGGPQQGGPSEGSAEAGSAGGPQLRLTCGHPGLPHTSPAPFLAGRDPPSQAILLLPRGILWSAVPGQLDVTRVGH